LKPFLLANRECLEQSEVPVLEAGLVDEVAHKLRVERTRGRLLEDRRAVRVRRGEPLVGVLRAIRRELADDFGMAADDVVLAVDPAAEVRIQAHAGVVFLLGNTARRASLKLRDAADLPSTERLAGETRSVAEKWQVVKVIDDQDVAGVEFVRPPQEL